MNRIEKFANFWDSQPRFELVLKVSCLLFHPRPKLIWCIQILDLNNVPLSSGMAYVRWHLPASSATEHRGSTDRSAIVDHRAYWRYEKVLLVRLTIERNRSLHECGIVFEVIQEFGSDARGGKSLLGRIKLNLSEYVSVLDDNDPGITRRYLMQDSKINGTLNVTVIMRQIEGEKNYTMCVLILFFFFVNR